MEVNPLKQYFRQPAIYVRLPSQGQFYPEDALVPTENGELPVLPMTTLDEITYRTPDALFNGTAVAQVIQSCVPNIKNAWVMPSTDIDTVMVAIRIATYGHTLDVSTRCPQCATEADYDVDLRKILEQLGRPDYDKALEMGDLVISFRPMTYQQLNESSMTQFEDQKMLQMMDDAKASDEEKLQHLGKMIKKITEVTTRTLAEHINQIHTPQARVTEQQHILEWLSNCDRAMFNRVRDHIIQTKKQGEIPPLDLTCANCDNRYEQTFTLNMSNFFEDASLS